MNHRCGHEIILRLVPRILYSDGLKNDIIAVPLLHEISCFDCLVNKYDRYHGDDELDEYELPLLTTGSDRQKALAHTIRHVLFRGDVPCDTEDTSVDYWFKMKEIRLDLLRSCERESPRRRVFEPSLAVG